MTTKHKDRSPIFSPRHPEVRGAQAVACARASKDAAPMCGQTRAVALRGSALRGSRLRVTVVIQRSLQHSHSLLSEDQAHSQRYAGPGFASGAGGPVSFPVPKRGGGRAEQARQEEENRACRRATRHLSAFAFHGARTRAGPVVADGVAPGSARGCSCEPHPRVPHPAPPSRRLMRAPLSGRDRPTIIGILRVSRNFYRIGPHSRLRPPSQPLMLDQAYRPGLQCPCRLLAP